MSRCYRNSHVHTEGDIHNDVNREKLEATKNCKLEATYKKQTVKNIYSILLFLCVTYVCVCVTYTYIP